MRETHMDEWLNGVRAHCAQRAPDLLPLLDTYCAEARFGRRYIAADIARLPHGARILEVGAGTFLLSCQLVREGFVVTAIEPIGSGFSHFERLRELVRDCAVVLGFMPHVVNLPGEDFHEKELCDFAFSVNVMEHVNDVERVMANIASALVPGASYRFTCPNYLFPYEPHFNIPTLLSKNLTARVFGRRIFESKNMPDPLGTWLSLNWINVLQVQRIAAKLEGISVNFNRSLLVDTLERVVSDPHFASRRSPAMRFAMSLLVRVGLHRLLRFLPALSQPIMDCRIQKTSTIR